MAGAEPRTALNCLRAYVAKRGDSSRTADESERETQDALATLWRQREAEEIARDPSLAEVPRFYVQRDASSM